MVILLDLYEHPIHHDDVHWWVLLDTSAPGVPPPLPLPAAGAGGLPGDSVQQEAGDCQHPHLQMCDGTLGVQGMQTLAGEVHAVQRGVPSTHQTQVHGEKRR